MIPCRSCHGSRCLTDENCVSHDDACPVCCGEGWAQCFDCENPAVAVCEVSAKCDHAFCADHGQAGGDREGGEGPHGPHGAYAVPSCCQICLDRRSEQ